MTPLPRAAAAPTSLRPRQGPVNGGTAPYRPPYNRQGGSVQRILGVSWQRISGVWLPIDAARALVVKPLTAASGDDPPLAAALHA